MMPAHASIFRCNCSEPILRWHLANPVYTFVYTCILDVFGCDKNLLIDEFHKFNGISETLVVVEVGCRRVRCLAWAPIRQSGAAALTLPPLRV
jgi:hypothetical protein